MVRYSIIHEKNPREIVLLRGSGCKWKQCTFCDYHLDSSKDEKENYQLNHSVLQNVTGIYHHLEVINSGSFTELDNKTMNEILAICKEKNISQLHFECHYLYRKQIPVLRKRFAHIGTECKIKIGVETFDFIYREKILHKGILTKNPEEIAKEFNECCLLFGLMGQTVESMKYDIEIGLRYFERVCVNIMVENTTVVKPDREVIQTFVQEVEPLYRGNDRVDILMENTDFGVGAEE